MGQDNVSGIARTVSEIARTIAVDGFAVCRAVVPSERIHRMRAEVMQIFGDALANPGGVVNRGPHRWYAEIYPESVDGLFDIAAHPLISGIAAAILGDGYRIVEFGFDVSMPGSQLQPWHRDFPADPLAQSARSLTSLAFNVPLVEITPEEGPLELAPRSQWQDGTGFEDLMFPPAESCGAYERSSTQVCAEVGDITARTALAIHRGTPNRSKNPRPVIVIGMDAIGAGNDKRHGLAVSHKRWRTLPESVKRHLDCPVHEVLPPMHQRHQIPLLEASDELEE